MKVFLVYSLSIWLLILYNTLDAVWRVSKYQLQSKLETDCHCCNGNRMDSMTVHDSIKIEVRLA